MTRRTSSSLPSGPDSRSFWPSSPSSPGWSSDARCGPSNGSRGSRSVSDREPRRRVPEPSTRDEDRPTGANDERELARLENGISPSTPFRVRRPRTAESTHDATNAADEPSNHRTRRGPPPDGDALDEVMAMQRLVDDLLELARRRKHRLDATNPSISTTSRWRERSACVLGGLVTVDTHGVSRPVAATPTSSGARCEPARNAERHGSSTVRPPARDRRRGRAHGHR